MRRLLSPLGLGLVASLVTLVTVLGAPAGADPNASGWHLGYYTPSPHNTLSNSSVPGAAGAIATFKFTNQPNTALLVTSQKAKYGSLLGDQSGASNVSATMTVRGVTGAFSYYGEPSCGGTTANVRFYFETSTAGGFNETQYWWSNPVSWAMSNGTATITNPFGAASGADWSDYYGHFGSDPNYAAGFAEAISNVKRIGVSFGGGCGFENGVGTTDGSGAFTLDSYSVS